MQAAKNPAAIHVIIGEIQNVVAAMRVNSRWASSSRLTSHPESPLLQGFKNLSATLYKISDISEIDTLTYLKPFLGVIRSEETSGPITGVALSSIHKFLNYGFINESSSNAAKAMSVITEIVTHCRFEATAPDSDEVVLATILEVLLACLVCPAGFLLTDELVQEMIQTCFRMSIQKRLSELLRKRAERTLHEMVHTVFLNGLSYASSPVTGLSDPSTSLDAVGISESESEEMNSASADGRQIEHEVSETGKEGTEKEKIDISKNEKEDKGEHVNSRGIRFQNQETAIPSQKPYGIGCLTKMFSFLCGLTLPCRANSEGVRHLALTLVNSILETLPHSVKQMDRSPSLFNALLPIIQNDLCHHLLLNLGTDDLAIFTLTLRAVYNLFVSFKGALKTQVEAFFLCLLNNVMDSKTASYEKQEMALECIVEFCSTPNFMVDLYVNYDCDIYCSNLFENMCKFLYKNAFPVSGSLYTIHILSLDGLLAVVNSIAQRCNSLDKVKPPIPPEELVKRKQLKRVLALAAEHWNRSYKEGLKFMQEMNLLPTPLDGRSVALFLRNTPGLDKTIMGEYLGKDDPLVAEVLREYVHTFDFTGQPFVNALRSFLETFMVPKEAQQIERVLESYGLRYFTCNSDWVKSSEACYVLTVATVILNVDLHNPKVAEKMKLEQFINNLRGLNGDENFPEAMLTSIYKSIEEHEFKLLEDYTGGKMTQVKWNSLLKKSGKCAPFVSTSSNAYDKDIFSIILGCPIIAAISVVFDTATDDSILQKALGGFNLCAQISAHYVLSDVFDNLVISLCNKSTLLSPPGEDPIVTFGRNRKAQMATKAVFLLTKEHSNHFREAWKYILDCILSLYTLDLLPSLTDIHLQLAGEGSEAIGQASPSLAKRKATQAPPQSFIQSLLSTIALTDNNEPEPSQEEVLAIQQTRNTIDSADIKSIFLNTTTLQADSLLYLLKALILADRSVRPKGSNSYPFDEEMSRLCLDLITAITLINKDRVILLWVLVYEHLAGIIGPATTANGLVERGVSNLMLLCQKLLHTDIADQILRSLSLLLRLSPSVATSLSTQISQGIIKLLQTDPSLLKSSAGWSTVLPLIRSIATSNTAAGTIVFKALAQLMTGENAPITLENFFEVFHTVRAFAVSRKCPSKLAIEAMECMYSLFARLPQLLEASSVNTAGPEHSDPVDDLGFALIPTDNGVHVDTEVSHSTECEPEWGTYWQPILAAFAGLCQDGRLDVRNHAMTYLQRALLSTPLARLQPQTWLACFELVVFPLLNALLVPHPKDSNEAAGLEETRFRASALLSKIFLQYMQKVVVLSEFESLWFKILQFIELYMKADDSELLAEAVPESLKNILLVMSASGVLAEPSEAQDSKAAKLWEASWARIGQFCPLLKNEFNTVLAKTGPSVPVLEELPELGMTQPTEGGTVQENKKEATSGELEQVKGKGS